MSETSTEGTVTVKWAHHTEYDGQPVKPGDTAQMTPDNARAYAAAGMLQVDPEDNEAMQALGGTAPAAPGSEPSPDSGNYDPKGYTADEVNTYLATAEPAEVDRVLALERAGKNRSSINGV